MRGPNRFGPAKLWTQDTNRQAQFVVSLTVCFELLIRLTTSEISFVIILSLSLQIILNLKYTT
jgi:hypothetical protein